MPNSPLPLVSALMPVRFGQYLAPALDSILAQADVDFEVICIDDGADDGVARVLAGVAARDARLRVIRNSGRGIAHALNSGLRVARGALIARMDADDVALPLRFATQVAFLEKHPDIGVLGAQAIAINSDGRKIGRVRVPIGARRVSEALQVSSPLIHPTVMMRRDLVTNIGGYRPLLDGAEDYDLWLRLSTRTHLDNLAVALLLFRRHSDQVTIRGQFRQASRAALALVAHNIERSSGCDPLSGMSDLTFWREAFTKVRAGASDDVRELVATRLVDNGGTLRDFGARYLQRACRRAIVRRSSEIVPRMALACVRHELKLLRARRLVQAARALIRDLLIWRARLVIAYARHANIFWRAGLAGVAGRD